MAITGVNNNSAYTGYSAIELNSRRKTQQEVPVECKKKIHVPDKVQIMTSIDAS